MRLQSLCLCFVLLPWAGCGLADPAANEDAEVRGIAAETVAVAALAPRTVTFDFTGSVPVDCYELDRVDMGQQGQRVDVKVIARHTGGYCLTVVRPFLISDLSVSVPSSGSYTFAFWRGEEDEALDVTVTVP